MKDALKAALSVTELIVVIGDIIKIILLIIVIHKVETFGSAFMNYTSSAKDAILNSSVAAKEKVAISVGALSSEKEALQDAVIRLKSSLLD